MSNIIKLKAVKNLLDFSKYVLSQDRHPNEKIIEINSYIKNVNNQLRLIEDYQQQKKDKRGKRPRAISLILAFPNNKSIDEIAKEHKRILTDFYKFVSVENNLGLNDEDIKKLVSGTPGVIHYGKNNNSGHSHNLLNRVYWNRNENKIVGIDISKKIYHRELMSLSGHTIAEQIQNKPNKPLYNHKLDQLTEQFNQYKNINAKIDRLIALALKDIKRKHSQKALKKLQRIKQELKPQG